MDNVELIITLDKQGRVTIRGPIENQPLLLFMLEHVKDALKAYGKGPHVIRPTGSIDLKPVS